MKAEETTKAFEELDPIKEKNSDLDAELRKAHIVARGALYLQIPEKPYPDGDRGIIACPNCKSGEYLYNEDGNRNEYCGQCGKRIDWT